MATTKQYEKMSRYHLKQYEKERMKMAMLRQEETFRQQVQELHRLYRAQQLLMADAATNETRATAMAMPPAATRRDLEVEADDDDERRAAETDAGSSRSWDDAKAPPLLLRESELELTLALGCFGAAAGKKEAAARKEASSSVDSRTSVSVSSSSTESGSGSPERGVRRPPPPSLVGSVQGGQPTSVACWAASGSERRAAAASLAPQVPEFGTIG